MNKTINNVQAANNTNYCTYFINFNVHNFAFSVVNEQIEQYWYRRFDNEIFCP